MAHHKRFNQAFIALMLAGLVSALLLPQSLTNHFRGIFDNLLAPIAYPVRILASNLSARVSGPNPPPIGPDHKPASLSALADENESLKGEIAILTAQLEELKRINEDRAQAGPLRELCRPFAVMAADTGNRQTLKLEGGSSLRGLSVGMPVLNGQGLIGRIDIVGIGGASVQLITDTGLRVNGQFSRFGLNPQTHRNEWMALPSAPVFTVAGNGRDAMTISHFKASDVKECGVQIGDWVLLNDRDWPQAIQRIKLGKIQSITPDRTNLFVTLTARPHSDLKKLNEVLVLVKKQEQY